MRWGVVVPGNRNRTMILSRSLEPTLIRVQEPQEPANIIFAMVQPKSNGVVHLLKLLRCRRQLGCRREAWVSGWSGAGGKMNREGKKGKKK